MIAYAGLVVLVAIAVICIAANELRKRGIGQRNAHDLLNEPTGDWPNLNELCGGVDLHRSGDRP